uniref:Uncharacterized protein n=1 Tax=Arundo donax TaxID=35708 RepID=A0A0A9C6F8_ARUDO
MVTHGFVNYEMDILK